MAESPERTAFRLEGRTALVTGAASGIGKALAQALWGEGMRVVLADRDAPKLDEAMRGFDGDDRAMSIELDVTDRAAWAVARDAALARFGRADLLANIAGVGGGASIVEADFNDWDWVLGVNLGGVINGVVTFLPTLKANPEGAVIVNMGSILSTFPQPGQPGIYGVSKAAILAFSDSLRWSLQGTGVRVATVCPGFVDTAIALSEAKRPDRFPIGSPRDPGHQAFFESILKDAGMSPAEVARKIVDGVKAGRPHIMTHAEFKGAAEAYWSSVLAAYGEPGDDVAEGRRAAAAGGEAAMRAFAGGPAPRS